MRRSSQLLVGCALASPLLLLVAATLLPSSAFTISMAVNAVSVLVTAAAMYVTAGSGDPRLRRSRLLFAVALVASAGGFAIAAVHAMLIGHVPELSPAVLTRLIWVPCALIGLFLIPSDRYREGGRLRVVLDGVVATAALGLPFWMLFLQPVWFHSERSGLAQFVLVAYPIVDFVIAVAAYGVASHARGDLRRFLRLMALGLALVTVSDAADAVSVAVQSSGFGWNSVVLQAGLAILLCAALLPTGTERRGRRTQLSAVLDAVLPHVPIVVAVSISTHQSLTGRPVDTVTIVCGTVVVLGLIARQVLYASHLAAVAHRLSADATRDSLTGLDNRRSFLAALETSLAERAPGDVAVVLLDLDGFKEVNDTFGHDAGDAALVDFAARLERTVGDACRSARLGGDEFAVLVVGDNAERRAWRSAETLVQWQRSSVGALRTSVGASAGVAVSRPRDTTSSILRRADLAMYDAKRSGPSSSALFVDEMAVRAERRHLLAQALPGAAARGELELVHQPLFRLDDGSLAGAEALLRWHSPVHGEVSPAEFIPLAEETGAIVDVGQWVLATAVVQLQEWNARGWVLPRMSINVSARQLTDTFAETAVRLVAAAGVGPSQVTLEITESAMPDLPANRCVEQLRAAGFPIAMDDFGAGFSSLAQLAALPVDTLKFDRELIRGVATSDGRRIVEAIISLAHDLRLTTVAEGIETTAEAAVVLSAGCDLAQGFHFSRPLSAGRMEALLRDAPAVPAPRDAADAEVRLDG